MIIPPNYTPVQIPVPDDKNCDTIYNMWHNIYRTNQDTFSYISYISLAREYNLIYALIKTDKLNFLNYPYTEVPTSSAGNIEFYKLDKYYDLVLKEENDIQEIVTFYGIQYWYKNKLIHRDNDLPAMIYPDGSQAWYQNGRYHRDNDLPALICKDGRQLWFKHGVKYDYPS